MQQSGRKPFAKRSLGQNFLSDPNYIRKIVEAVDPRQGETIVEIGPGRGALTKSLVESSANVVAIELDRDLSQLLTDRFSESQNFRLIEGDVLDIDLEGLLTIDAKPGVANLQNTKLAANLPYYISTAVLQRLALHRQMFSAMVLMFQREVVERITAKPGDSKRGFLTVLAEASFEIERLFDVPPTAFTPKPKIWSSVVRLTPKPPNPFDRESFRQLVGISFAQKRKTIANNLRASFSNHLEILNLADIEPGRRAESLTLDDWSRLSTVISDS